MDEAITAGGPTSAGPFRRSEHAMSHIVYGLILAVSTLGELIDHEVDARDGAAALYATGLVLLAAHLFSDVVARMIAGNDDVRLGSVIRIGTEDLSVALGGFAMGSAMLVADLVEADPSTAMTACFLGAMGWLAVQTFIALRRHSYALRLTMATLAVVLATVIVALENLH
jgi:hypothetical protein